MVQALRLGASDYFIKPVAEMALLEMSIRRSLEQAELRNQNKRYRQKLEQANLDLKQNLSVLEQDQQAGRYVQMKMSPDTPEPLRILLAGSGLGTDSTRSVPTAAWASPPMLVVGKVGQLPTLHVMAVYSSPNVGV